MKKMKIAGIVLIIFGLCLIASALTMHFIAEDRSKRMVQAYMDYASALTTVQTVQEPLTEGTTEEQPMPTPATEPLPEIVTVPEGVMGVMVIEKIDLIAPIAEGTNMRSIQYALGHFKGTALPGETGNFAVAGHRSYTFGEYFSRLDEVTPGDMIKVLYGGKNYEYEVDETYVVEPQHTEVLDPTPNASITLVTCTPKWTATHRLIVRGHLTEAENE